MILGVKGFNPGLVATHGKGEFQYKPGLNTTDKAKCANTGFHLCEDPLDCLTYYPWDEKNEFWAVAAGGDIDEDCQGTRISCTEITLIRRLTPEEFILLHANYVFTHPSAQRKSGRFGPFQFAHENGAKLKGKTGDWLCFITEKENSFECIAQPVDGIKMKPDIEYTAKSLEAAYNEKV